MARTITTDQFGKLMLYEQKFRSSCPLLTRDFHRLRDSQHITLSSSSESDYSDGGEDGPGDDIVFQGDEDVSFSVNERKKIRIRVGNRHRVIPKVSYLPMNDRVLHYCSQMDLGHMEEKIIEAFTSFLRYHRVRMTGLFGCIVNVMPPVTTTTMHCEIEADRPVPIHTPSMPSSWRADEVGVVAVEREDGQRLFHFTRRGYCDRENIRDEFIYSGGDFDIGEPEIPMRKAVDPAKLVKEAMLMKCLSVEWLRLLNVVASHAYVTPHVKCLEEIVEMWKDGKWNGDDENEKVRHALEMKRKYAELEDIPSRDSQYSEGLHKAKAGLKYAIMLEADVMLFAKQTGRRIAFMEGGHLLSLEDTASSLDVEYEIGPAFDIEVSIRFVHGYTTTRRIEQAAKRAKTLHEVSRMLGLDSVYELGPYLQRMNWGSYVAGGCFLFRKNMVRGRDIEDYRAWHFKVKQLVGYIYSNKLSRKFLECDSMEAVTEGETVYYRETTPGAVFNRDDPRLSSDCLEKYVGGAGFDPNRISDGQHL